MVVITLLKMNDLEWHLPCSIGGCLDGLREPSKENKVSL